MPFRWQRGPQTKPGLCGSPGSYLKKSVLARLFCQLGFFRMWSGEGANCVQHAAQSATAATFHPGGPPPTSLAGGASPMWRGVVGRLISIPPATCKLPASVHSRPQTTRIYTAPLSGRNRRIWAHGVHDAGSHSEPPHAIHWPLASQPMQVGGDATWVCSFLGATWQQQ